VTLPPPNSEARARSAAAQARNTEKGRRREELAILEAQLEQAGTQVELARSELQRQQQLLAQGFVQRARVDDAALALRQAEARRAEVAASLRSGKLPARVDERASAEALAAAASQARAQVDWRLAQMSQRATTAGQVIDTYREPGEWIPAGTPVLAVLPASGRKSPPCRWARTCFCLATAAASRSPRASASSRRAPNTRRR
jgi:HlyD family secretion protein